MAEPQKSRRFGLKIGIVVIVLIVVVLLLVGSYVSSTDTKPSDVFQSTITPSAEVESGEMLKNLRATEDTDLTSYGWVDRKNGVVHIPIDQAMDLILQRGLPIRQATPTPSS